MSRRYARSGAQVYSPRALAGGTTYRSVLSVIEPTKHVPTPLERDLARQGGIVLSGPPVGFARANYGVER